jgi:hypothetical protein
VGLKFNFKFTSVMIGHIVFCCNVPFGTLLSPCFSQHIKEFLPVLFQKAIKEQGIDLWEMEKDVLGTEKERQRPQK